MNNNYFSRARRSSTPHLQRRSLQDPWATPLTEQPTARHTGKTLYLTFAVICICIMLAILLYPLPLSAKVSAPTISENSYQETNTYQYPIDTYPEVLNPYSPGEHNWNPGHRGVDLRAEYGQTIYAASSGRVIYAGILNDRPLVSIENEQGIRTTYEPVSPSVTKGQSVAKGEAIGTIDGYHCGIAVACLHWGAKRGESDYINPLWLINPPIVRLLE